MARVWTVHVHSIESFSGKPYDGDRKNDLRKGVCMDEK